MNQYGKLEPLENAAKYAFKFVLATNKEGNQKARQTKILRDQTVYDTPRKIVKLIPNFNTTISETMRKYQTIQIKRLRELRFGPSTPLRFNKFFGRPLLSNYNQDCFNSYTWEPMTCGLATSHAIATTNEKIMSTGKHFVSFQFHNLKNTSTFTEDFSYDIGIMRPLSDNQWSNFNERLHWNYFNLKSFDTVQELEKARSPTWTGNVDICMITPHACKYVQAFVYQNSFSPNIGWGKYAFCALSRKKEWITTNENGEQHCELLLDLDKGTLAYYRNGIHQKYIGHELSGDYVWVIQFNAEGTAMRHTPDIHFRCYTY